MATQNEERTRALKSAEAKASQTSDLRDKLKPLFLSQDNLTLLEIGQINQALNTLALVDSQINILRKKQLTAVKSLQAMSMIITAKSKEQQ